MISFFMSYDMMPFTSALLFLVGLLVLEFISLMLGGTVLGLEADGPEIDLPDPDLDLEFDFDADATGADLADVDAATGAAGSGGPLAWLGVGEAPFILWMAGVAASFGLAGYGLQLGSNAVFGGLIPAAVAVVIALVPGLLGGKIFARAIARLAPKTETTAVSRRHLGGRLGVITQGTAAKGRPAECRVKDRHGQTQYIRVEPREDGVEIPRGADVIVLRPREGVYHVIPFGED